MSNNDLTNREGHIPQWVRQKSTGASIGNVGVDDIKPPEIKLLQATSPEVAEQPGARAGEFWLTGRNINLGPEIIGTPIILHRSYVIWNPTKSVDSKGPLAVATDAIHWDIPDQTFEVRYPNNPTTYIWKTKRTVAESGLDKFGSSRPEDRHSPPAASLTFQILWGFRLPDGRPQMGVVTNSRSGVKAMRELLGMIDGQEGVDCYFQRYRIQATRMSVRPGEYFFGYKYFAAGLVDEAEGDAYQAVHNRFLKAGFSSSFSDEMADTPRPSAPTHVAANEVDADEINY